MKFGQALEALEKGSKVARSGWNGVGMFIYLLEPKGYDKCICMYTTLATHQPGWLASQADMFADDWYVI